jgi:hypothetical protein
MKNNAFTKVLFLLSLLAVGCSSVPAARADASADDRLAAPKAGFFRVWRGFRRPDLDDRSFLAKLAPFMKATTDLYGRELLSNYLVALPPEKRPAQVPAEFALVALESEAGYRAVRATPAGQAYTEAHWELFDRENSKSAALVMGLPERLEAGTAYDLSLEALDWREGENLFFLGTRKAGFSEEAFLARLRTHLDLVVRELRPLGLRGYIVLAEGGYEAAFLNWESEEARLRAFEGAAGPRVMADAAEFMDGLQYSLAAQHAPGASVEAMSYLSTRQN